MAGRYRIGGRGAVRHVAFLAAQVPEAHAILEPERTRLIRQTIGNLFPIVVGGVAAALLFVPAVWITYGLVDAWPPLTGRSGKLLLSVLLWSLPAMEGLRWVAVRLQIQDLRMWIARRAV